jgi:adenylosuccinate lyase
MQRFKYKLWREKNMNRVESLWLDYNTAYQEFRQDFDEAEIEDTEFLYDFLDNYLIYTSDQLKIIIELMDNFLISVEDIENALEDSDDIGMLAFLLSETYIYHRYDHEKRQQELYKQVEEIDKRRQTKYDYQKDDVKIKEIKKYKFAEFIDPSNYEDEL